MITRPADSDATFDAESFRAQGYRAIDIATEYLAGMRERPVFQPVPADIRATLMDAPLPVEAVNIDDLMETVVSTVMPYPMGNGHPRFFGWANSPPSPAGILADVLAATMDPSCAGGDHAAIYLERAVNRWLMELVGFPTEGSMGILTSGGSMASMTAIATARHAAAIADGWNDREAGLQGAGRPSLVMYLSGEGHTTMVKAAELIGIGNGFVRKIPVDADFRMDLPALETAITADQEAGMRPFLVAASAGTVSTGTIDPLDAIADLCQREGLWFHIDGSLGAVGVLDERVAERFAGMERADSLALDPHKWLSVPVECGCALIRDGAMLRDTFSLVPPYVRTEEGKGFGGLPWFSEYGFQQTRGFRALKVWMTLAASGREGIRSTISRHNDLARLLAARIRKTPELELLMEPTLCVVCFRFGDDDDLNKRIMETMQADGRAFVTQAVLNGDFWLRANIFHYATNEADLDALVEIVCATGEALRAEASAR